MSTRQTQKNPHDSVWVDIDQAATHFGVSVVTVRRWISAGKITGYRLGGLRTIRIDLAEAQRQLTAPIPTVKRAGR